MTIKLKGNKYTIKLTQIGKAGAQGEPGMGLPAGGDAGEVLVKTSSTDYDTEWIASGAVPTWGGIQGTLSNQADLVTALDAKASTSALTSHTSNTSNPHSTTKAQVGLSNVDNTSDASKPVSTAQQTALNLKANQTDLTSHTSNTSNPHSTTKSQVGLGNVDNTSDASKPVSTATQTALNLKANTSSLATVATTGSYNDLTSKPTLGTAAAQNTGAFATSAQGAKADSAVQSIVAGTNVTVDNTDPQNPIVSASGGGGGGGAVDSVNTQTGVVVLDADDIDDSSTTHKYVTATDLTKLSNTSGTNTGDQDLSGLTPNTRTVSTGTGLTGGGDLSANRTISLDSGSQASLALADSALQSGDNISELTNDSGFTSNTGTVTSVGISGTDGLQVDSGSPVTTSGSITLGVDASAMRTHLNVENGADVTDAANVDAAGAVMVSDTATTGMGFVIDEDDMSSNSATKVPTQQSVKAYVDAEVAGGGGGGMTNPMTTSGDIIIGGSSGTPTRLAAGTDTHVLTLSSGAPVWAAPSGGGGGSSPEFETYSHHILVAHAEDTYNYQLGAATTVAGAEGGILISHNDNSASSCKIFRSSQKTKPTGYFDRVQKGRLLIKVISNDTASHYVMFQIGETSDAITNFHLYKRIGFRLNASSTFYAANANGTIEVTTNIASGVSINAGSSGQNDLVCIHTPAVNDKYYNRGVLLATHTTGLASGNATANTPAFGFVSRKSTDYAQVTLAQMESWEGLT